MLQFTETDLSILKNYARTNDEIDIIKNKIRDIIRYCSLSLQSNSMNDTNLENDSMMLRISVLTNYIYIIYVSIKNKDQYINKYEIDIDTNGNVNMVQDVETNFDEIRENCHLKKFPLTTEHGTLQYNEQGDMVFNGQLIDICYLGNNLTYHSYSDPLCKHENYIHDNYILFPEYNFKHMVAFVANRYTYGMNVNVCFLDHIKNIIYCGCTSSIDYPNDEGIALRKTNNRCEIYLYSKKMRKIIYQNPELKFPFLYTNVYNDNLWTNLNIDYMFSHLRRCIEWLAEHNYNFDEFKNKINLLNSLSDRFYDHAHRKEYLECSDVANQFILDQSNHIFKCGGTSQRVMIIYELARIDAVLDRLDNCMEKLLSIENEFSHWNHLVHNEGFDNLEPRNDFKELISRHLPNWFSD